MANKPEKEIAIDMVIYNCENETDDTVLDKFIEWVESNGWLCGGSVKDITEEVNQNEK